MGSYHANGFTETNFQGLVQSFFKTTCMQPLKIVSILTCLFQQSLESGILPVAWKHAYITPIFKKGNKADSKKFH